MQTKAEAHKINENALTRREVLQTAAGAGLALVLTGRAEAAADQWTAVGKSGLFAVGKPRRVTVPHGGVLYVTRTDAKALTAVSAKCTHRGCEVAWAADASQLQCPCHGAAFASTGKNIHGPRRHPEDTLPTLVSPAVRERAGVVEVNLGSAAPDDIEPLED
jgi:cytochrome b6-f complex iron-sulfur subunit